jgi:hypothetical protein
MHKILLAIKQFIAFNPMKENIDATMRTIVMDEFIKPVQKALDMKQFPNKQQQFEAQLQLWKDLYDDKNIWEKIIYNQTKGLKQTAMVDDYIGDALTELFIKKDQIGKKINPYTNKPRDLINYIGRLVSNHINDKLRSDFRHAPNAESDTMTDDQGKETNIFDKIEVENPNMGGDEALSDMMIELKEYIKKHDESGADVEIFEVWMKAMQHHQNPNFSTVSKMLEKKTGLSEVSVRRYWTLLKAKIVKFFEHELGYRLTEQQKSMFKLSTITILAMEYKLAYEETRRQMARFVLGSLHELVGVEFQSPDKVVALIREERKKASEKKKIAGIEPPYPPSALDGMPNEKARKVVSNVLHKHTPKGILHDTDWQHIHAIFKALDAEKLNYSLTKADYMHDEQGRPKAKEWKFEVYFTNKAGKPTILYGSITASGAGTVEDPLEKYDVTAILF